MLRLSTVEVATTLDNYFELRCGAAGGCVRRPLFFVA